MAPKTISKNILEQLYVRESQPVRVIAKTLGYSEGGINYWLRAFSIPKRTISQAIYAAHNPHGDPFHVRTPKSVSEGILFGLGLGLYWGEGTKASSNAIRLGNTDPALIKAFIHFLKKLYGIPKNKFRFGLQIFSDMEPAQALVFWSKTLNVRRNQFQKVIVTRSGKIGTYRNKTKHGVLTIYVHNVKLRKIIGNDLARVAQW